jgi:multidrug efflux pump subunit AcrA (membrane-fusion protein)
MLLRICLIVAILAGIGAGVGAYLEVSNQIPQLTQQRDTEKTDKESAQHELAQTKTTLKKTQADLAQTQQDLSDTKNDLAKSEARAEAQGKRADDLADKLAKASAERDDAQNQLASYKATSLTPDQIIHLNKDLKEANMKILAIQDERDLINRQLTKTRAELSNILGVTTYVMLPAELHGKITVVDPKWDFVVVNIGDEAGVVPDGELLVSRNGKLVAKVIVKSVEKDRAIANVVPGWKLGEMYEGDDVTPAHPAS